MKSDRMRTPTDENPLRILLLGTQAERLRQEVEKYASLVVVEDNPELVVSYGGDGTLLDAELAWPNLPKAPILNSKRGLRCIPHPPEEVVQGIAEASLIVNHYTKLRCDLRRKDSPYTLNLTALNEFNVHMSRINSAVRFQLWFDDDAWENGAEILGDGFVVCTPFGSTAYYNKITRGSFRLGMGVAFKNVSEHTTHTIVPENTTIRIVITRGPAVLAFDSSQEYYDLETGDALTITRHERDAVILTCDPVHRLDQPF
jgi:NAD+ kinase